MEEPATAPWGLRISDADFEKLKAGFQPQDMDDKWHVTATTDQSSGTIFIHFARSWTGKEIYVLHLKPPSEGDGSGVTIESLTWEQNKGGIRISEEQGKKEVMIFARCILQCEIEALPEYDASILWNHPGAQIPNGV